jgi:hypothetical protein
MVVPKAEDFYLTAGPFPRNRSVVQLTRCCRTKSYVAMRSEACSSQLAACYVCIPLETSRGEPSGNNAAVIALEILKL